MSIVYNSVALFFCDSGFNLIGTNHRRCQDTGEWTGQTPQCIGMKQELYSFGVKVHLSNNYYTVLS